MMYIFNCTFFYMYEGTSDFYVYINFCIVLSRAEHLIFLRGNATMSCQALYYNTDRSLSIEESFRQLQEEG